MKKWLIVMAAVLLSGCTMQREINLNSLLAEKLQEAQTVETNPANHQKKYYSYYIEPQIGRYSSNASGNVFVYEGTKFAMNVNVSALINKKYYPEADDSSDAAGKTIAAEMDGTYTDINKKEHAFRVTIYEIEHSYLTTFTSDTAKFYAISGSYQAAQISAQMLQIARNLVVNTDEVIAAYSNKEVIQYSKEKIELFEEIAPESGRIEELFEDYRSIIEDEINGQEDQGMTQIEDTSDISGW